MEYITVDPAQLSVEVTARPPKGVFAVPSELPQAFRHLSPIEHVVYYDVLYPATHLEHKKKHPELYGKHRRVAFKLVEPDPWLVAVGYLMWQGIIQGLTWDSVKAAVRCAISKLNSFGLAPPPSRRRTEKTAHSEVGFTWTEYATNGRKQREMFLGLRRIYRKMSEEERGKVGRSQIQTKAKPKK